ncbi:MAG: methyltransferase domain-containing protein, partial [Candidatus Marinimicrobia bacterium]|nr:methyltransferase domain-containing protein [Candidatus Neomarinimicrobiota bacterium]MCF7922355.1 methyltransferase domain-containing protein [Candidatus Neomarinimicrobiota bacterium]
MIKKAPSASRKKVSTVINSIGPVENLESYVKADWWKHIFNANYLRTDGDVVEDTNLTKSEIDLFLKASEAETGDAILDLCCGQGRHTLELARRGFTNLVGLDRSHYLINRAKNLARNEGLSLTFREGDARKFSLPTDQFDRVFVAGNSFGYFESSQDDDRVLREIKRVLKPGGMLLLDLADGGFLRKTYQPRSWEWIDDKYFVCRERSLSGDEQRLISREVITHVKKGVIADQFYAERLYTQESIQSLLERNNFHDVQFHGEIVTDSSRNQDLGMMAQRLIITAKVDKAWTSVKKPSQDKLKVTVLMGDPRKVDTVKPNSTWDTDDFETIKRLKDALARLDGFQFSYLDNHDTLIADLSKSREKTDLIFNLCDEGFFNDAVKELHVPALLEILNLPYTGGNPQCLAHCFDKSLVRGVAQEMDIPVPRAFMVTPEQTTFIDLALAFPVIVKPNFGDSSIGITQESVCYNVEQLENAIFLSREKVGYEKPILIEEYLTGKDISVGIIGSPPENYRILPIIAEDYSDLPAGLPQICGYEAKWNPDSPYACITSIPAELPAETERFLGASCVKLFMRLGCRDYARFDWRLDENGTPRLLEVNPNPGWCWDGHLARMSELDSVDYGMMLDL